MVSYKPDFITSEQFRSYATTSVMGNLFSIDGKKPANLIKIMDDIGRPIKSHLSKTRYGPSGLCKRYKVAHVIAIAKAKGMTIQQPGEVGSKLMTKEKIEAEINMLEIKKAELEQVVYNLWPYKVDAAEVSKKLSEIPVKLPSITEILKHAQSAQSHCGVYFLIKDGKIVYVGQSVSVLSRVSHHSREKEFDSFSFLPCTRPRLDVVESIYIHLLQPEYNGRISPKYCVAPIGVDALFKGITEMQLLNT